MQEEEVYLYSRGGVLVKLQNEQKFIYIDDHVCVVYSVV